MASKLFENQNIDIPLRKEVAFIHKSESYKVHVHIGLEGAVTIYKLYFKNNIEDTNKSMMKLVRNTNSDGSIEWACLPDYFCVSDNEMAAIAGAAIDKVMQEKLNVRPK